MIEGTKAEAGSQISVLRDGDRSLLYCCHSMRVRDMAGNPHVLSVGVDLAPALDSNGVPSSELVDSLFHDCLQRRGEARIPKSATQKLSAVANVLNIAWIEDALSQPARIICPRSTRCPRSDRCEGARPSRAREIADVRDEIFGWVLCLWEVAFATALLSPTRSWRLLRQLIERPLRQAPREWPSPSRRAGARPHTRPP